MRTIAASVLMLALAASAGAQPKQTYGPNPNLPFSAAVKADGLIYVSGSIAATKGADIRKQTQDTLDQIGGVLKQAGSSLANAANVTVYLRNAADAAGMNEVFAKTWPANPPARTTVVVQQPLANADGVVEIAMIAIPNGGERTVIHPKDWAKVPAPYSYAIKSGNTLFMSGLVGRMFREFALTLTIAVVVSAVVSLTLTPMMCARLLKPGRQHGTGRWHAAAERFAAIEGAWVAHLGANKHELTFAWGRGTL